MFALLSVVGFLTAAVHAHAQTQDIGAPVDIQIQLKWKHQFQFAGFYAAEMQGYFKDAGLNVRLIEGGPSINPSRAVLSGKAQFGVGNSTLIIDRSMGKPVVAVAAYFQRSPFVILARRDHDLESVRSLEGRTLMLEEHAAELLAYLRLAGVDMGKVRIVPHSGDIRSLAKGTLEGVDASSAYTSTEPYFAIRAGIPVRIFDPRDLGIDFYGDTLFTSQTFADEYPDTVRAVRQAVNKGWEYAIAHQDEVISYILRTYASGDDRTHLGFEAQVTKDLIAKDLADIGYMSRSRWNHIADVFSKAGLMAKTPSLDGFMFEDHVELPAWVYQSLGWLAALALVTSLMARRYYRINCKLKKEIARREELERELRDLATTDSLSGLANRRHLEERAAEEYTRSRRHGHDLGVIMLDLDGFKELNDKFGHVFGDRCIRTVADACLSVLRDIDLAARYGGDEFVILLPETNAKAAATVAERLRQAINALTVEPHDAPLSVSIGLGFLGDDDRSIDDVIARADADMYRDKRTEDQLS